MMRAFQLYDSFGRVPILNLSFLSNFYINIKDFPSIICFGYIINIFLIH